MKVTQVSIQPTEAARRAGSPSLTPELLAASAARYSRNNEGLESILAKIDPANLDKSVDSIFRMLDYGHQSIADMVPVAMFIDGISIWLAYYIWTLCPTAGGQESSTRYIEISADALVEPQLLGIVPAKQAEWQEDMRLAFAAYSEALELWGAIGDAHPELTSIPEDIRGDSSPKGIRTLARMQRNYRFDRARVYLPVAAATNMMLIMSARGWAALCRNLASHLLPEARKLAQAIRDQLELSSPRLMKHAHESESTSAGIRQKFERLVRAAAQELPPQLRDGAPSTEAEPTVKLDIMTPADAAGDFAADLKFHENRYAWIGDSLSRTAVRFSCNAISMGEIRDLNRHRTGNKYCPLRPLGFYGALDRLPQSATPAAAAAAARLRELNETGRKLTRKAHNLLADSDPAYIHRTLLGTQYYFEHLTTADKFIYEAELRTGIGSHYRYAKHLKEALSEWYRRFPETANLINEGNAEPE